MIIRIGIVFLLILLVILGFSLKKNEDLPEYSITIKDHYFEPARLEIPAGKKIRLLVKNLDNSVEEFESFELKREKIVPAGGQIKVIIGPLQPGKYKFFGEFHEATAQGIIEVK